MAGMINGLNEQQDGKLTESIRMGLASDGILTRKPNHVPAIILSWHIHIDLLTQSSHRVLSSKAWAWREQSSY